MAEPPAQQLQALTVLANQPLATPQLLPAVPAAGPLASIARVTGDAAPEGKLLRAVKAASPRLPLAELENIIGGVALDRPAARGTLNALGVGTRVGRLQDVVPDPALLGNVVTQPDGKALVPTSLELAERFSQRFNMLYVTTLNVLKVEHPNVPQGELAERAVVQVRASAAAARRIMLAVDITELGPESPLRRGYPAAIARATQAAAAGAAVRLPPEVTPEGFVAHRTLQPGVTPPANCVVVPAFETEFSDAVRGSAAAASAAGRAKALVVEAALQAWWAQTAGGSSEGSAGPAAAAAPGTIATEELPLPPPPVVAACDPWGQLWLRPSPDPQAAAIAAAFSESEDDAAAPDAGLVQLPLATASVRGTTLREGLPPLPSCLPSPAASVSPSPFASPARHHGAAAPAAAAAAASLSRTAFEHASVINAAFQRMQGELEEQYKAATASAGPEPPRLTQLKPGLPLWSYLVELGWVAATIWSTHPADAERIESCRLGLDVLLCSATERAASVAAAAPPPRTLTTSDGSSLSLPDTLLEHVGRGTLLQPTVTELRSLVLLLQELTTGLIVGRERLWQRGGARAAAAALPDASDEPLDGSPLELMLVDGLLQVLEVIEAYLARLQRLAAGAVIAAYGAVCRQVSQELPSYQAQSLLALWLQLEAALAAGELPLPAGDGDDGSGDVAMAGPGAAPADPAAVLRDAGVLAFLKRVAEARGAGAAGSAATAAAAAAASAAPDATLGGFVTPASVVAGAAAGGAVPGPPPATPATAVFTAASAGLNTAIEVCTGVQQQLGYLQSTAWRIKRWHRRRALKAAAAGNTAFAPELAGAYEDLFTAFALLLRQAPDPLRPPFEDADLLDVSAAPAAGAAAASAAAAAVEASPSPGRSVLV